MKKLYRIWKTKNEPIEIMAECPSMALEQANIKGYYWKIELVKDRKKKGVEVKVDD